MATKELDYTDFQDLQLDAEEIDAFYEAFQLFDENGDQTIDAQELKNVMKALGKPVTPQQLNTMMGNADKN